MPFKIVPSIEMTHIKDDEDEIEGLIYCENCLRWKDGICETWGRRTPSFGFCHMAVDKSKAGEYEKWKMLEETKKW